MKFATHQQFTTVDVILVPHLQMFGSADKLIEISQWGNIAWTSMNCAFTNCQRMQITATDTPNLSNVTDAALMFYLSNNLQSPNSLQYWDTSHIKNFSFMFATHILGGSGNIYYNPPFDLFNPPNLNNWNVSSATDLSYMFMARNFNQNLSSWDVSSVKNMSCMFAATPYNYPLNNWNTESLERMYNMFYYSSFNQPLNNWNTSKVTNMIGAFSYNPYFNQPLDSWDVSNVTKISSIFNNATSYNQSLANWNLASLTNAVSVFSNSAVDCDNYSKTLAGWANNPNTANNIAFTGNSPMQYASNVVDKRNILLNKNWTITGDSMGSCLLSLSVLDNLKQNAIKIYPNPATENIYIKNVKYLEKYDILDYSGRLITSGKIIDEKISVKDLTVGNYLLNLYFNDKVESYKFIKK
jgi:surface protein